MAIYVDLDTSLDGSKLPLETPRRIPLGTARNSAFNSTSQ